MKSITIRCTCGSQIDIQDAAETLINSNGTPDKKGRKFLIEVRADEWLDRHQSCVDAKNKLTLQAIQQAQRQRTSARGGRSDASSE